MRDNSNEDNRQIVSQCVSSINKVNHGAGMIEEKNYLIRVFMEHFQLRHARILLDHIEKKTSIPNKLNLFCSNFNVVKTGCLLIEVLELVSNQFEQLKVRCKTIRERIEVQVSKYMQEVSREQEMRYLLLEKDIEDRDALDLITRLSIFSFLRTQFAENVVKEIWRSPYAAGDSIFNASTNFYMLFGFYHCVVDEE